MKLTMLRLGSALLILPFILSALPASAVDGGAFIEPFNTVTEIASTVPANGDVNPYGVAVIPHSTGSLVKGNILVSNFNNSNNLQGTGTTIVQIAPNGKVKLFAKINANKLPGKCPGGIGLTTALVVLRAGWVIVGSLPAAYDSNGNLLSIKAGCLLILNSKGKVVKTLSGNLINGPWDMTALEVGDVAELFVANVLNGTVAGGGNEVDKGTIVRIILDLHKDTPRELSRKVIGSGFGEETNDAALVIGPTGLGLGKDGTLYVADTLANRITAIRNAATRLTSAGTGKTVSQGGSLNGPLGLAIAPNGDILVVNSGDGNMVEVTPGGSQVAVKNVDETGTGAGTLFGLAVAPGGKGIYLVNDGDNELDFFTK